MKLGPALQLCPYVLWAVQHTHTALRMEALWHEPLTVASALSQIELVEQVWAAEQPEEMYAVLHRQAARESSAQLPPPSEPLHDPTVRTAPAADWPEVPHSKNGPTLITEL